MTLSMRRIVLFTKNMPGMVAFYRDVLGLKLRKDDKGWKEFDANGCVITLHNGTSAVGRRPPKMGFWAKDVSAARDELLSRGAKMSKLMARDDFVRCEGKDPDGNPFYVSNRP
jgi:catechol 2,3-dioxygenase-like lactoylglutathione lyase family enzyme